MRLYIIFILILYYIPLSAQQQLDLDQFVDSIQFYSDKDSEIAEYWICSAEEYIASQDKIDSATLYQFYKKLGYIHLNNRNYAKCAESYELSLSYCINQDITAQEKGYCGIFNDLGIAYTLLNQKRKGIEYFKKGIHCKTTLYGNEEIAVLEDYINLSRACFMAGLFQETVDYCDYGLSLLNRDGLSTSKYHFIIYLLRSRALLHLPESGNAGTYLRQAEQLLLDSVFQFSNSDWVYLYKAMLRYHHITHDTSSIHNTLEKYNFYNTKRLQDRYTNISSLIDHQFLNALYHYRYLDIHQAKTHIDSLMRLQFHYDAENNPLITSVQSPADIITHLQLKLRIYFQLCKTEHDTTALKQSVRTAELGFQILDLYRRILNDADSRMEYVEYEYELYDESFNIYYEAWEQDLISANEFWELSEKARAIHISEQSNIRSLEESYSGLDSQFIDKENLLIDSIFLLTSQLLKSGKKDSLQLSARITDLRLELYNLQDELAGRFPTYQQKRVSGYVPSIEDIQQKLQREQVMIEYLLAPAVDGINDVLITFMITANNVEVIRQEISGLSTLLKTYYSTLQKPPLSYTSKDSMLKSFQRIDSIGFQLKNILLPREIMDKGHHFVIIPHKELFYVPFSSLPATNDQLNDELEWSTYKFLAEEKEVTYAFSGKWWLQQPNLNEPPKKKTLIVHTEQSNVGQSGIFQNLVKAERHVSLVQDRDALLDSLENGEFKLVYFAGHAAFNEEEQNGYIYLNDSTSITFHDLLGLNLEATNIVLAACETQTGEESRAEGLLGFVYNFAWAGASAVTGAMWQIPDLPSNSLLQNQLVDQNTQSLALSSAQRSYLQNSTGLERHPYYWAGIVSFDSGAYFENTDYSLYYFIGALLLGAFLVLLITKIVARTSGRLSNNKL